MEEIREAIKFYDSNGWDWSLVVAFLSHKNYPVYCSQCKKRLK